MFQHPKKDFSPRHPCAPSPEPAAASNLADQRAASYHAGEHAPILLASELPLWPSVIFMTLVAIALGLQALEAIKEAEALVERFSHSADRRTILPICKGDGDASRRVWENLIARSDT
jgi:hypothetical protein